MLRRSKASRRSRGRGRGFASRPRFAFVRCVLVALALWVFVPYLFTGLETIGLLESRLPEYAVETGAPVGAGSGQGQQGGQDLAAESKGGLTSYWKALWGRMLSKGEEKPRGLQNLNQLPAAWQSFNSGVKIKLYEYQSQQLMEMDLEEYVVGVVAGEMPASFGLEALKAQAVAARTYGVSRMVKGASPALAEIQPAANVTNDHNINQAWIGEQERRKRWGSQFDEYEGKIRQAVGETLGVILLYEGEVTDPLYHASCGGEKTEAAVNVWGRSVPYLQAVECSGHQDPHTEKVTVVKFQDADRLLGTTLSAIPAGASLSGSNMCQVTGRTDSGRVLSASILGQEFTGTQLRSALGLPSANFQAKLTAEGLEVISKGYGHGVGMCQYGANDLANKGESWQDILKRYYVGAYVAKMSAR
ncbi:MAG: stage II sporulation protein D [Clostridiales bacterium]